MYEKQGILRSVSMFLQLRFIKYLKPMCNEKLVMKSTCCIKGSSECDSSSGPPTFVEPLAASPALQHLLIPAETHTRAVVTLV